MKNEKVQVFYQKLEDIEKDLNLENADINKMVDESAAAAKDERKFGKL